LGKPRKGKSKGDSVILNVDFFTRIKTLYIVQFLIM